MLSYTIHFTRTVNTGELSSTHDISGAGDCIIDGPHATLVIVATLVGMATATVATVVAGIVRAAMASAETSNEQYCQYRVHCKYTCVTSYSWLYVRVHVQH